MLASFKWTEYRMGMVGPGATQKGSGTLTVIHRANDSASADILHGDLLDEGGASVGQVDAVKQSGVPTAASAQPAGGDWD